MIPNEIVDDWHAENQRRKDRAVLMWAGFILGCLMLACGIYVGMHA